MGTRTSTHVAVVWENKCMHNESISIFLSPLPLVIPLSHLLLLCVISYGMEYPSGWFRSGETLALLLPLGSCPTETGTAIFLGHLLLSAVFPCSSCIQVSRVEVGSPSYFPIFLVVMQIKPRCAMWCVSWVLFPLGRKMLTLNSWNTTLSKWGGRYIFFEVVDLLEQFLHSWDAGP